MFDLEQAIAGWRRQMQAAGLKTPVPLEELEIHLRDEIALQMKSGTNAPLAFEMAVQQIGMANVLKDEFEKVDATKVARTLKQYRAIMVACLGVESLFWATCLLLKIGCFSEITAAQQMSGLAAVAVMISAARVSGCSATVLPTEPASEGPDLHFKRQAVGAFVGVVFLLRHRAGWILVHTSQIRRGPSLDHAAASRGSIWLHWWTGKSRFEKNGDGRFVSNQEKACQTGYV